MTQQPKQWHYEPLKFNHKLDHRKIRANALASAILTFFPVILEYCFTMKSNYAYSFSVTKTTITIGIFPILGGQARLFRVEKAKRG
jgi:hypothetical protein